MAGHLLITDKYVGETKDETKAIRRLIKDVRADLRELRETGNLKEFEQKYIDLPREYVDKGETQAYLKHVDVPESIVWGGRASLEIHFSHSRLSKIYLVA